jgi:response regulator of citrate/malate metabolism
MNKTRQCILLVDDNSDDNFFHEREIKKTLPDTLVITMNSGIDTLNYLKSTKENTDLLPDLIFLDINMPLMTGWEFLEEFILLDNELQNSGLIFILSTSENPQDITKAMTYGVVKDYIVKPLTRQKIQQIADRFFND